MKNTSGSPPLLAKMHDGCALLLEVLDQTGGSVRTLDTRDGRRNVETALWINHLRPGFSLTLSGEEHDNDGWILRDGGELLEETELKSTSVPHQRITFHRKELFLLRRLLKQPFIATLFIEGEERMEAREIWFLEVGSEVHLRVERWIGELEHGKPRTSSESKRLALPFNLVRLHGRRVL